MTTISRNRARALLVATALLAPLFAAPTASAAEAPHAALPLIGSLGGTTLTTAKVVPIYFSADPLATDLAAYYAKLARSSYLGKAVASYGITSITIAAPTVISDAPPASILDTDAAAWLASEIAAGALPAEDGNTMYEVHYPASTVLNVGGLYGESSQQCYGYQFEAYLDSGTAVPFGVVPVCSGMLADTTDLQLATLFDTINIANIVTDPYPYEAGGYEDPSWSGSGWAMVIGSVPGYMCRGEMADWEAIPADLGYTAARIWSNTAAAAGHDPCPDYAAKRTTYFNAAPDVLGGTIFAPGEALKGLILPATGGSLTIPVRLFSDGPTADWTLSATERLDLDGQASPLLSFSFDRAKGNNGDVVHLTITRAAAADGGIAYPSEAIPLAMAITSTSGTISHDWFVIVGNE